MKKIIIFLVVITALWQFYNRAGEVTLGPGVKVSEVPYQKDIRSPVSRIFDDYSITDVAEFKIMAKVLSRKNYSFGRGAELVPIDLALGWGNMSDESILEKIDISQSGRFYRWRVEAFPIPRREIETHSANMHIIPANDAVKDSIDRIRKGDIVELSGSLVNVIHNTDNWYWNTSTTRNDVGKGACELIWVESLVIKTL